MYVPRVSPLARRTPTYCAFPWLLSHLCIYDFAGETYFDSELFHRRDIGVLLLQERFQLLPCYISRCSLFNNIMYPLTGHINFPLGALRSTGNVLGEWSDKADSGC